MPPKAKADTAGYQKLKKDLSAGTPGQLYLLHGEETYLRDYYLGRLREKVLAGGLEEFNFHPIAAKDMSPHALEEAIDCLPMMAERTLVLVTDFDLFKAGEKDREEYIRLLGDLPDYVCLVFVYDLTAYKADGRSKLAALLKEKGKKIATAESCTAGYIPKRLTDIPGASEVFECGIVSYSNDIKTKLLGVSLKTLETYGAVSEQTAREMALGAKHVSGADIAISTTGLAGPGGDGVLPGGLSFTAVTDGERTVVEKIVTGHENDREYNRYVTASRALNLARLMLEEKIK